jgi:Asp-tRNA(Asn)/Glu-tRNA(Gln) amidotransferase B subunit
MNELENNNDWISWSKYVLKNLESLGHTCDSLAEEISSVNVEVTKIATLKHTISEIKEWKTSLDETINVSDLEKIKDFYIDNKDVIKIIESVKESVTTLKKDIKSILDEHQTQIEDYKKFKTKVYTIIGVVSFLFGTALTLLKIFF